MLAVMLIVGNRAAGNQGRIALEPESFASFLTLTAILGILSRQLSPIIVLAMGADPNGAYLRRQRLGLK